MNGNILTTAIVFVIYLCGMLAIGIFYSNKNKDIKDYVLGGRNLGVWVTALSAQASDMSGWLLMGLPGLAFASSAGSFEAFWTALGLALGTYFNWLIVAKRLRIYSQEAGDAITLPDYFAKRFEDNTHILKLVSAIFIIVFFLFYTASGFVSGAKLFGTIFGMDYSIALLITGLIVVSYTFLGGFMAVCWTDFIQGTLMFLALMIVPGLAFGQLGGAQTAIQNLLTIRPDAFNFLTGGSVILLFSGVVWGLGYFGQPHILARFMAIRNPKEIKVSRRISIVWVVVTLSAALLIGMLGIQFGFGDIDSETIFMQMVGVLCHPIVAAILYTAILAAIMSTADSQLLVCASAVADDIYRSFFKKDVSGKKLVFISRIAVLVITIIALFIASNPNSGVFRLVSYAWAGFGATFGPIVLLSVFWKKANKYGAIAGMLTGGLTVIIWNLIKNAKLAADAAYSGIFTLYELLPAFLLALAAIIIVSLATKGASKEIEETFDKVQQIAHEK